MYEIFWQTEETESSAETEIAKNQRAVGPVSQDCKITPNDLFPRMVAHVWNPSRALRIQEENKKKKEKETFASRRRTWGGTGEPDGVLNICLVEIQANAGPKER